MGWDYVMKHTENCHDPTKYTDENCINDIYKSIGIDKERIDDCIYYSGAGGDTNDSDDEDVGTNSKLDAMLTYQKNAGIYTTPSIVINNITHDDHSALNLFNQLCLHFYTSNAVQIPELCEKCADCGNKVGCIENNGKCVPFSENERYHYSSSDEENNSGGGSSSSGSSAGKKFGWTLFWLLFISMICGAGYYYYKVRYLGDGSLSLMDGSGTGGANGGGGLLNNYMQLGTQ